MADTQTLLEWFARWEHYGNNPAVIALEKEGIQKKTFAEIDRISARFASGLQEKGIGPENRIAFVAPSSLEWVVTCLGVIRAGAVPTPLDVQYDDDALAHALSDSQPQLIVTESKQLPRIEELELEHRFEFLLLDKEEDDRYWQNWLGKENGELPSAEPDDEAVLFYTSGTTGPPKGVPLTHKNLATQLSVISEVDFLRDDDRLLLPLPLHHVYPFVVGMLTPLSLGLQLVLPYSLTGPQMVRALNEGNVTIVIGVPRMYRALYEGIAARAESAGRFATAGFRLALGTSRQLQERLGISAGKWLLRPLHRRFGPQLRVAASGGSPLDSDLARKLESLGWQVAIGYGLTETSPLLTINPPGSGRIGAVGQAIPGTELRIERLEDMPDAEATDDKEIGEILARGPSVFSGYRNLPEKTEGSFTEEGWYRTGDLGFFDEDDYLHVTGRAGTMIVTEGGENVQPGDVEDAYSRHPAIRELGVLEEEGHLVALLVPNPGEVEGELDESIQQAIESRGADLPSYQRLSEFHLTRESLPRTRLGKIQRHKLEDRYQQAKTGNKERAEPMAIGEMAGNDRALLEDRAARQTWDFLADKFADHRLTPDTNLQSDLSVDSLEWINLSLEIRKVAGVELDEETIGRIETVRDLLEEMVEATAGGEQLEEVDPLEDPESTLSDRQLRHLKPRNFLRRWLASGLFTFIRTLMKALFRLEAEGVDQLPAGPVIIVPNHGSHLDSPAIIAALPSNRWLTTYWAGWTGTMFVNPLMRFISRIAGVVPVDPQRGVVSSLAFGAAVLDRGHSLVWYPEGRRSEDGTLKPFRQGIGLLLEQRPTTVIPTAIEGAYQALPPGSWLPRPRKVIVKFGKPIQADQLLEGEAEQAVPERIAHRLHEAVASQLSS